MIRNALLMGILLILLGVGSAAAQPVDFNEEDAGIFCATCGVIALVLPILVLITSIVIAVWINKDARARGDQQPVLWALIGFFLNVIGLVIYLIARPKPPAEHFPEL